MEHITVGKLFRFYIETINNCGAFILELSDEKIGYHIFKLYFSFNLEGKYTLVFPDGSYFEFSEDGNITAMFDRNGNKTSFSYNSTYMVIF